MYCQVLVFALSAFHILIYRKMRIFLRRPIFTEIRSKNRPAKIEICEIFSNFEQLFMYLYRKIIVYSFGFINTVFFTLTSVLYRSSYIFTVH